ncbi:biopolymer transport protein ExbD/TolR [Dinoroseobacter shibae DFL 12 = DSM 16493]|uniref:Biopolymer transport protein ExbD/TolR n=1 Tax=Dinoroseobacter shibae (strain DSM 16493 / NCIMB 14021 / DFL 12) TaxID=398580 RepID=A8LPJ1_DINSH|nr:biopolymer transporter ExbD [Dinoroseobacter shibae]ABV92314.1 biopolymer transport protein ExbD/TolR [Dinoroseobacter shibae DFL 12 = DSM 16493]URF47262.1 biopolymer transporter ExbD [Dinoroseobacter shibae]URF51573.1 biopolymer transporter ExbD [Dinoroseobacter shibae]
MRIPPPPKPLRNESIIPMINVVFLLLIFFLITAEIRPADPIEVVLPSTEDQELASETPVRLFLSADGLIAFDAFTGETALAAALEEYGPEPGVPLQIRADYRVPGTALAALLRRLAEAGIRDVELTTAPS